MPVDALAGQGDEEVSLSDKAGVNLGAGYDNVARPRDNAADGLRDGVRTHAHLSLRGAGIAVEHHITHHLGPLEVD